jgi:hypothetical protein
MQEAVTKLTNAFNACASITVTYAQGFTTLTGISATQGRTPYEILDGGVVVPYESHDFIIAVADLAGLTPKSNDTITDSSDRRFIVSMPGKMNVYESFAGIAYKIHTKAVT